MQVVQSANPRGLTNLHIIIHGSCSPSVFHRHLGPPRHFQEAGEIKTLGTKAVVSKHAGILTWIKAVASNQNYTSNHCILHWQTPAVKFTLLNTDLGVCIFCIFCVIKKEVCIKHCCCVLKHLGLWLSCKLNFDTIFSTEHHFYFKGWLSNYEYLDLVI